jgi:hypothetical protein
MPNKRQDNKKNQNNTNKKDKSKEKRRKKIQGTGHGKASWFDVGRSIAKTANTANEAIRKQLFLKNPRNYHIQEQTEQDIIRNLVINRSKQNTIASPDAVHMGGVKIKRRVNNGSGWLLNSRVSNGSPNMNQVSGPSILNRASQFANTTVNKGKNQFSNFMNRSEIEYRKKVAIANRNR